MPLFLPVTQAVGRRVSFHTFMHLLYLDLTFHMEKVGAVYFLLNHLIGHISL